VVNPAARSPVRPGRGRYGRAVRAIQITEFGGPEVLRLADLPVPQPGPGQVLIQVDHAGVNYADTHQAENSYLSQTKLPLVPGSEVVGRTEDGTRVLALTNGGYAEYALGGPPMLFELPAGVTDGQALALAVQGLTAWHLLRTSTRMAAGESVVVHAGAGGVGTLAIQLARQWGAGRVIATASSAEKRALAEQLGADIAVEGTEDGLADRLREANNGRRVDIVLEMVGGRTFDESLAALAAFGRIAVYGAASRVQAQPIAPGGLMYGSRSVVGFWLTDCVRRPELLTGPMAELMDLTAAGALKPLVGEVYPLAEAYRAHEDLRARRSTGKLILAANR
jgi:NADPH:quinone reductase